MRSSFARPRTSALRRAYLPAVACLAVSQALAAGPVQNPATPPEPPAADAPAAPPAAEAAAAPANADAVPKASDHSEFHGSVQLDNQYSPETDPLRATLALSYTNLFSKQDEMSALYQVAPQDAHQVGVFAAAYGAHPLPDGLQPQIYFIDSNTNVPTSDTAGVLGKGQVLGGRLSHAIGGGNGASQSLTLGFDYKHFRNATRVNDDGSSSVTPVSYLNLSLAYAGSWSDAQRDAALTVSANFGPHGGANAANAFADGDFHARSDYFYLRADGAIVRILPKGLRLYVHVAGQYSRQSLIIDEDYPVSGIDGVRGYLEAEVLGDRALKSTVQLQSPTWQHGARQIADGFVYFDAAVAELVAPLPGETALLHPRSWGFGLDVSPMKNLTGSLVWARPMVSASTTQAGETRILFLLRGTF
jgi:hemolysin activation/secretion protein